MAEQRGGRGGGGEERRDKIGIRMEVYLVFTSAFLLLMRCMVNPFSTGTHLSIHSTYFSISYTFRNSCEDQSSAGSGH